MRNAAAWGIHHHAASAGILMSGEATVASYPTVANSLLWIDRFRSATDASGMVPAVAGDLVRTISLPTGWGASLGDGLVVQATAGNRPTYRSNGLQGNGTSTRMTLPSALSLNGAFTAWIVVDFNGTATPTVYGLSGNAGTYGGVLADRFVNSLRCYSDDASSYIRDEGLVTTGKVLIRIRRTAANAMYFDATTIAESAESSTTYTWAIDRIFARGGSAPDWTNSGVRFCQWVVVGDDAVTAGTSAAVEAKLLALEGVSI